MSLADLFHAPTTQTNDCKACGLLAGLDEADRAVMVSVFGAKKPNGKYEWPHTEVAARLTAEDYAISEAAVRRHRAGCL